MPMLSKCWISWFPSGRLLPCCGSPPKAGWVEQLKTDKAAEVQVWLVIAGMSWPVMPSCQVNLAAKNITSIAPTAFNSLGCRVERLSLANNTLIHLAPDLFAGLRELLAKASQESRSNRQCQRVATGN